MNAGVLWALVAAVGFALLQASNRKANRHLDAYRTAFGLLVAVEVVLLARSVILGRVGLLFSAPMSVVLIFGATTLLHFVGGWTLLALSQQKVGVARTGALVSAAPVIGTLVAAVGLDEPLTTTIIAGVLLAVAGVALISLSGAGSDGEWRKPWLGLSVALIWGSTPLLIRIGLERYDHPVEGLTIGLATSVVIYAILLTLAGRWKGAIPGTAMRWMAFGGLCGAIAVSAQWVSFDLTTIAVAITVQQLSVLFVIALVPFMFREPFERMNLRFFAGAAMVVAGACLVVLL